MTADQIIEMQAIETLRSLSPDDGGTFLRELIEIYLQDTPQRLTELDQALAAGHAANVIRAAHSIKGSSGNFGACNFAKLAAGIEASGKSGDLAAAATATATLKADYARVADALARIAQGG